MAINNAESYNHQPRIRGDEKLTVLIVDDSKVIRLALNKILKNDFTVIQANDGQDAWEKLSQNDDISAVFSDVSMPVLDGFGLLERVRTSTNVHIAGLPFIIITANDDDADFTAKVRNAGGSDLITKPFKTNEIMACIESHIVTRTSVDELHEADSQLKEAMSNKEVSDLLGLETNSHTAEIPEIDEISFESHVDHTDLNTDIDTMELDIVDEASNNSNDSSPAVETSADSYNSNHVEFTIDEDFFNEANDVSQAVETTHVEESHSDISSLEMDILDEEFTLDESFSSSELSLEPMSAPAIEETIIDPVEEVAPANSKRAEIEKARERAKEIATEKAATEEYVDSAENARLATERSEILAELSRIREKEINNGTYLQDIDYSTSGKISSFFNGLMRIISKFFGRS